MIVDVYRISLVPIVYCCNVDNLVTTIIDQFKQIPVLSINHFGVAGHASHGGVSLDCVDLDSSVIDSNSDIAYQYTGSAMRPGSMTVVCKHQPNSSYVERRDGKFIKNISDISFGDAFMAINKVLEQSWLSKQVK